MLTIWAVLSVVFIALAVLIVPLVTPKSASSVAGFANLTEPVFTVLAIPAALFVWVFVFYSLIVFRQKAPATGRVEDLEDGAPLQPRTSTCTRSTRRGSSGRPLSPYRRPWAPC